MTDGVKEQPPEWAIRTEADRIALREGCWFDMEAAQKAVQFIEYAFRSQYIPGKFKLLEWQKRFLMNIYGWKLPNGSRRFRRVNLHISKKNGKTTLVAAIALYELFNGDSDTSPYIASGSTSGGNAQQIYDELKYAIEHGPYKKFAKDKKKIKFIGGHDRTIEVSAYNSTFSALSNSGPSAQGLHLQVAILDECHEHQSDKLYDSLLYSQRARPNGMLICISTAGSNVSHWYHRIYTKSKNVLAGKDLDINWYAEVYEADEDCDLDDVSQWYKANPSLGVAFTESQFKQELATAKTDNAERAKFIRYSLNRWHRSDEFAYFSVESWDKSERYMHLDDLTAYPCFMGVDGSVSLDPTSISLVWCLPGRQFYTTSWAFIAEEAVKERNKENLRKYAEFISNGEMKTFRGSVIDQIELLKFIRAKANQFKVKAIRFDSSNMQLVMQTLQHEGYNVLRQPQSEYHYNGPMREFNRLMLEGNKVWHTRNEWVRYCLSNVRVRENKKGEIAPDKGRQIDKTDGAISTLLAFGEALTQQVHQESTSRNASRYEGGLFVL